MSWSTWCTVITAARACISQKDRGYVRLEHDTYIWQHLRRGNASEIAAHLGVSYVYVYQRYRVMLAESRRRNQPQLPGMDSPETDGA